ncbi:MAG: hypothetical protein IJY47_05775 [Clostridia bacterium]|nr:hypothetical protein [Clostridia bacterium]
MKFEVLTLLTTPEEEQPLWKEIWSAFYETYINDSTQYEHLDIGSGSLISVRTIIFGLFIGLTLASFGAVFNKRVLGGFVRRLLREECLSPETGKTLPELGIADKLWIRRAVRKSVSLRRVVRCREEEEALSAQESAEDADKGHRSSRRRSAAFRVDPDQHHFYIPEDMKYLADVKFEQKGTTWLGAILFIFVMIAALIALLVALPYILEIVNDFVGAVKPSSGSENILN